MVAKRLKLFLGWALILFIVIQSLSLISTSQLGQVNGLIITLIFGILFAGFAGFKAEQSALKNLAEGKGSSIAIGFSIAVLYGIFSSILRYFISGKFDFNSGGILTIFATIIGAYIAEKKYIALYPQSKKTLPTKTASKKSVVIAFFGTIVFIILLSIVFMRIFPQK